MVEHYTTILPFKPKNWVLFNWPTTLEDAIALIHLGGGWDVFDSQGLEEEVCRQAYGAWDEKQRHSEDQSKQDEEQGGAPRLALLHAKQWSQVSRCFTCRKPRHFQNDSHGLFMDTDAEGGAGRATGIPGLIHHTGEAQWPSHMAPD